RVQAGRYEGNQEGPGAGQGGPAIRAAAGHSAAKPQWQGYHGRQTPGGFRPTAVERGRPGRIAAERIVSLFRRQQPRIRAGGGGGGNGGGFRRHVGVRRGFGPAAAAAGPLREEQFFR
ncbi:unnamed protein product, partial [Scytosiphon promiscuus]